MHYDKFLPVAKYADILFTTDFNCISKYRSDIKAKTIQCLPFAAQPSLTNPINNNRIKKGSVCFAGSYYSVGHDHRKKQMDLILPLILEFNGDILDRQSRSKNKRYAFPEIYRNNVKDAVDFNEMVQMYKTYKVFLNVNTITDSPSMLSRRVYELLASGTPIISTPSLATEKYFDGIVQTVNNKKEASEAANKLLSDKYYYEKISHKGYRCVMENHTYANRKDIIYNSIGLEVGNKPPMISVICCTMRPEFIDRIVTNLTCQNYKNIELILVIQNFTKKERNILENKLFANKNGNINEIRILDGSKIESLGEKLNYGISKSQGDYIAKMDDDDLYFKNYLRDMIIPFSFGNYGLVGKLEVFAYFEGEKKFIRRYPKKSHIETDLVFGATFIIPKKVALEIPFESRNTGEDSSFIQNLQNAGYKVYSSDPFNFIWWRSANNEFHSWKNFDSNHVLNSKLTEVISNKIRYELVDL
jgi:hypothetical protein